VLSAAVCVSAVIFDFGFLIRLNFDKVLAGK
jgi:hypothetical protein